MLLVVTQEDLGKKRTVIEELKKFFVKVKRVDEAKGPGHRTYRLGTSRQLLNPSSQLYEGCLRLQARQGEVVAELQGERA